MAILGPTNDHDEIRRWAEAHRVFPAEQLPERVDGEPAELRFLTEPQLNRQKDMVRVSWADFFAKFDAHGLAFAYDDTLPGRHEILQSDQNSPYRHPDQKPGMLQN